MATKKDTDDDFGLGDDLDLSMFDDDEGDDAISLVDDGENDIGSGLDGDIDGGIEDVGLDRDIGAVQKKQLSNVLLSMIQTWREENVDSLIRDAKEIGYGLNKDELLVLTDFVVPDNVPSIVKALETAVANWMRLAFHAVEIADLENGASVDLKKKAAQSLPDPEEKTAKKFTEKDRESVVEIETEDSKRILLKIKKVKMKLNTLVACTKEYVNILKKLTDYYTDRPV